MPTPELLAPAGNQHNLGYALAYGADAVYAGMPRYSLRVRNNDFDRLENLAQGIAATHAAGRLFYLATNALPHNAKLRTFIEDMRPIVALNPDALIVADPGVILLLRETWPDLPLHLSVQANTVNWAAVKFWQQQGIRRIILSRELSLNEVEEIRQRCPDIELELFVHGALCIAYSGRCLLSGYFNHRDANQGTCTNACRWDYNLNGATVDLSGDLQPASSCGQIGSGDRHPAAMQPALIEDRSRPGELMAIEEDEHGTYIMNSRDLRAVEHVARLTAIGIDSLKIEGRTKSHYYVARTTQVYRQAISDAVAGRPFDPRQLAALENLANRGYTDGFYVRHQSQEYQLYRSSQAGDAPQRFVGEITDYQHGIATVEVKNKFAVGDWLEVMTPGGNITLQLTSMRGRGSAISVAPGSGWIVEITLPAGDYRYGLLLRYDTPPAPQLPTANGI
jgi:U32 family peptidase